MNLKHTIQSRAHRYYKKLEIKDHNLLYLFLEITRKCNLQCLHCGSDCMSESNIKELTTDSWLKIIDYISQKFSKELVFVITGGEPIMHKELLTIAGHIQKNKRKWGMVSNAMLLSEQKFNDLIQSGLYSLTISLDGLQDTHNKLRNNSHSYEKLMNALSFIGKSDLKFKDVVTCVYPDNLNQLDDIAEILTDKGITSWRLFRIFPSGRAENNPVTQLSFNQTQEMLTWISENKEKYLQKGLKINLSCEGWLPFDFDKKLRDETFFCRSGVNMASILADGSITGCSNNDESFHTGNILNDDFAYVWNNKFEDFRERKWLNKTVCNLCEYTNDCKGGSIHLWKKGDKKPKFCYIKEL